MAEVGSSKSIINSSDNVAVDKIAKEKKALAEEKKRFLGFFVESLKGQDPTSPMDHSHVINTMLSYQNTTNLMDIKGLLYDAFNESDQAKLSSAVNQLGQGVIIKGNDIELTESEENSKKVLKADIIYLLEDQVDKVKISIKDEKGKVISEVESAEKNKGMNTFVWNGELIKDNEKSSDIAKSGKYTYEVVATDKNGEKVKVTTFSGIRNIIDKILLDNKGSPVFNSGEKQFNQNQIYGYQAVNTANFGNLQNFKDYLKSNKDLFTISKNA
ncbi:MAG: hypothetical protein K2P53_02190 [Rickettsiales bacterium]|jgi:flagellar hook assembly protein FlgD|nr:hypothetical protein [Rickettsiales bacterium]